MDPASPDEVLGRSEQDRGGAEAPDGLAGIPLDRDL